MGIILDCSSYESAISSACKILDIDRENLRSLLKSINLSEDDEFRPDKYIYRKICLALGDPAKDIIVVWHHGTRAQSIESFHDQGILPKHLVEKEIYLMLEKMSAGMQKKGSNPFGSSILGKQMVNNEGPFAVLFRELAIHASNEHHSYIECPEIIQDISGRILGENYIQLVEKYKSNTEPYVVSFTTEALGHELKHALWYLHSIEDGDSAIDSAARARLFFDSKGLAIEPYRILSAERIIK